MKFVISEVASVLYSFICLCRGDDESALTVASPVEEVPRVGAGVIGIVVFSMLVVSNRVLFELQKNTVKSTAVVELDPSLSQPAVHKLTTSAFDFTRWLLSWCGDVLEKACAMNYAISEVADVLYSFIWQGVDRHALAMTCIMTPEAIIRTLVLVSA